jgi:hypothetical protein
MFADPFSMLAVAIVFGVSAGMLNIWVSHRRKQQVLEQWHKERMSAMEKGIPLPELPASLFGDDTASGVRALRSGISLMLIGIIVYIATARALDEDLAYFGLIPCAVGLANLIYAAILWRRQHAAAANT